MYNGVEVDGCFEITPEILLAQIKVLEDELARNILSNDSMNELLDLYTVIVSYLT